MSAIPGISNPCAIADFGCGKISLGQRAKRDIRPAAQKQPSHLFLRAPLRDLPVSAFRFL